MSGDALVEAVRAAIAAHCDPERAARQQAYMKSAVPYQGLTTPELRALLRPVLAEHRLPDRAAWEAAVTTLWSRPRVREEWYAALAVVRHRRYAGWRSEVAALDLYEHLVRAGAWWDVVDEIATHPVSEVLAAHREVATPRIAAWSVSDDLWVRRTAVLSQLHHRDTTDTDLLRRVLDANLEGTAYGSQFFMRKAVGWALRQYAHTDPAWVRAYVDARADRLSGLSRREALKHLP